MNGQMGGMPPGMGMRPHAPQFNTPPDKRPMQKKQRQTQILREQAQKEEQGNRLQDYDDVLSSFDAHFQKELREGKAKKIEQKEMKKQDAMERKKQVIGAMRQIVMYQMQYEMYNRVADVSHSVDNLQSGFENRDVTGGSYADAVEDRYSEIVNDAVQAEEDVPQEETEETSERDLPYMDTSDESSDDYEYDE
jgi:hypothetical protein